MLSQVRKLGTAASKPTLGALTHFVYDAKGKATLSTWDKFPLCLPTDPYGDGFLGLNLHYVPQATRKLILDQLTKNANFYNTQPRMRMMANYGFLKTASLFPDVKPCIKRYLYQYVKSPYIDIDHKHFDKIVMMPTQRWTNGPPEQTE